jgi:hypothetical protein
MVKFGNLRFENLSPSISSIHGVRRVLANGMNFAPELNRFPLYYFAIILLCCCGISCGDYEENDTRLNDQDEATIPGYSESCKGKGVRVLQGKNMVLFQFEPTCEYKVSRGIPSDDPMFYMNANFFTPGGKPLGLAIVNKKRLSSRCKGGGYFYVQDGRPKVSRACPRMTEFAAQTHLNWGIEEGRASYGGRQGEELTWRNLVGEDTQGRILILVSGPAGQLSVRDLIDEGKRVGMVNAILFDAGSSVDYAFQSGNCAESFKVLPDLLGELSGYGTPPIYITIYESR